MNREESSKYRAAAAMANYMGVDRPDIQFAVQGACRVSAAPGEADPRKVKRIARYIQAAPKVVITMRVEDKMDHVIIVGVNSDLAACRQCRINTNGGVLMVGGMAAKTWSSTLSSVATCRVDAEYYALTRGSAEVMGLPSAMFVLGWELNIRVWGRQIRTQNMAGRLVFGRNEHIEVRFLWFEEVFPQRRLDTYKIGGDLIQRTQLPNQAPSPK